MKIIYDFLKQYNKEYDYYQKLSEIVADKIEDQLIKQGIKAEVTHRAKRPDKLKDKLVKRNIEKKYASVEEIYSDIIDLAGVRVSLYFPSERALVEQIITRLFHVEEMKSFPEESFKPVNTKRFSGYWATHYRVKLNKSKNTTNTHQPTVEIQVASVLMHAWSEVEHDLVYKPFTGNLSDAELAILDEINGLVIAGEIALERLKFLINERTSRHFTIGSIYELHNFIIKNIEFNDLERIRLGDSYLLYNFLSKVETIDLRDFKGFIKRINFDSGITLTDQLIQMMIVEYYDKVKDKLTIYFRNLNVPEKTIACSVSFIRYWIILERAYILILTGSFSKTGIYTFPDFQNLATLNILTPDEALRLNELKKDRTLLLQGIKNFEENELRSSLKTVKSLTRKTIEHVDIDNFKADLLKEFGDI
jgi:ppGpp synthetase/RelA/SpoT-type nucleotidyltranferase